MNEKLRIEVYPYENNEIFLILCDNVDLFLSIEDFKEMFLGVLKEDNFNKSIPLILEEDEAELIVERNEFNKKEIAIYIVEGGDKTNEVRFSLEQGQSLYDIVYDNYLAQNN